MTTILQMNPGLTELLFQCASNHHRQIKKAIREERMAFDKTELNPIIEFQSFC